MMIGQDLILCAIASLQHYSKQFMEPAAKANVKITPNALNKLPSLTCTLALSMVTKYAANTAGRNLDKH